ncbi:hypothetical protein F511_23933 [Dorcoceras hygrometricum]|uniref:Uncharacterized protein n=1 Tax=Dorcoceras hygrometricum TaxID=472368 RepID=A0A2Z7APM3_9LAMI|nr:hypothetical protein F511_23933 [Dorcoceras hygrometricum]
MRTRSDKRPNRKNDRKVLVAEESNKNWEDSYSDFSSSSSSSRDSEQEEVHCLMAKQTSDDEVFDFSNTEFTREDLINALTEMVHEYKKLSQTFEEVKAENMDLKNSSVEPSTFQLGETDSLQICRSQRGSISDLNNRNIGMIMLIAVYSSSTRSFNSQVLLNRSHQARQLQLTQLLLTGHGTTIQQGLPYSSNLGLERAKELSGSACENS